MTIIHPIAATASDIVLALTDNDLSGFSVSPNWTFFPFMSLVSNIVGGLWALGIFVATAAWIIAAFSWVVSKAIHNSTMQQYSGIVFVWIALGMMLLGSAVRVSERQFPTVHRLYVEAATTLDVQELPDLFVAASPILNASTIGMDAPKIVLNSALIDLLDEDELRFVLGHELGHALSGHALYQTLLTYLMIAGQTLSSVPFGGVGLFVVRTALGEWARKAELSGDRAGLLATQDVAVDAVNIGAHASQSLLQIVTHAVNPCAGQNRS